MKLLLCTECSDLVRPYYDWRSCRCGAIKGRYVDSVNFEYTGGVPIGLKNQSLVEAIRMHPVESPVGPSVVAFLIPANSSTINLVDDDGPERSS